MSARKSASLAAAICRLGAVAAGADETLQVRCMRFGRSLGIAAQLANDIRAVDPAASGKTDLALQRPTLPLTYAALHGVGAENAPGNRRPAADALWSEGAAQFTWTVAEAHRLQALDMIPTLTGDPRIQSELAVLLDVL